MFYIDIACLTTGMQPTFRRREEYIFVYVLTLCSKRVNDSHRIVFMIIFSLSRHDAVPLSLGSRLVINLSSIAFLNGNLSL